MNLTGLDIETTGVDLNKHHRLIQIGIVTMAGVHSFCYDVCPIGDMMIDAEAMAVNGFTLNRIAQAMHGPIVDSTLSAAIAALGVREGELTAVGWNVGGFDIAFIKKELPKTAAFFSHRALDLTGVAMVNEMKTGKPWRALKAEIHKFVADYLCEDKRHDALYDAKAALLAVDYLVGREPSLVRPIGIPPTARAEVKKQVREEMNRVWFAR